jgi:hypothetical protein
MFIHDEFFCASCDCSFPKDYFCFLQIVIVKMLISILKILIVGILLMHLIRITYVVTLF